MAPTGRIEGVNPGALDYLLTKTDTSLLLLDHESHSGQRGYEQTFTVNKHFSRKNDIVNSKITEYRDCSSLLD